MNQYFRHPQTARRPRTIDEIDDPPLEPVFSDEAAVALLMATLGGITVAGAWTAVRIAAGLAVRIRGSYESYRRIRDAAKTIEEYMGGQPRVIKNKDGDFVMMRGDKKIRLDMNNPHPHKEPHFHIEKGTHNGRKLDWEDAGPKHAYPFRKE